MWLVYDDEDREWEDRERERKQEEKQYINFLEVGDIIYPFIFRHRACGLLGIDIGVKVTRIQPICLWRHFNGELYTTALPAANYCPRENDIPRGIKYFGWSMMDNHPKGLKVFVEGALAQRPQGPLEENQAIRIIGVYNKSARGEIVEFRIKT
jgi:hypothetical protein